MDVSSQLAANMEDLALLFQSRMDTYEQRLQDTATAATHPDLTSLSSEFQNFKTFVWQTLSTLKAQVNLLTLGLDRHETFLRRKLLLIHGISETNNENLYNVITNIIKDKMNISDFTSNDLQSCHRLGSLKAKARTILVRFRDLDQRRLVWDAKTALKSSGIVISEFLTKSRHQVFRMAREHFGVRSCWSTDGKIAIVLPDKTRRKIESMQELKSLMSTFSSARDPKAVHASAKAKNSEVSKPTTVESKAPNTTTSVSRRARRT